MNTQEPLAVDYAAIKAKQNVAWSSGDYARIGTTLQIVGEQLAEAMELKPDSTVLDVAAGNGNATLAFARRWCTVTSTDYVETLLSRGEMRAAAEGFDVKFEFADAEKLPYADRAFDAVVSTFGVMFAPNQKQAASEMARVCRAGGRIGMTNWTALGFIGQLFKTLGQHVPPPPGLNSPAVWGDRGWIEVTFGCSAAEVKLTEREFVFRYRSPEHFLSFFRDYYGPTHKAFLSLDPSKQSQLTADLLDLVARFNTSKDGSMRVPSSYSELILVKAH